MRARWIVWLHHSALLVALVGAALFALRVASQLVLYRAWLSDRWGWWMWLHVSLQVFAGLAASAAVIARVHAWRRGAWTATTLAPFRAGFVALACALLVQHVWMQPYRRIDAALCLGYGAGAFAGVILLAPALVQRVQPRALRALEFALFQLCLAPLLAELVLRAWNRVAPQRLLDVGGAAGAAWIDEWILPPGSVRLGTRVNADGFFDRDVPRLPRPEHLVVCIGDSFSVGIVPLHRHYTSLCERSLADAGAGTVEVYNVGVCGASPPGYRVLLERYAAPLAPELIVVAVFVGNDVTWSRRARNVAESWLDREQLLIYQLPRRALAMTQERLEVGDFAAAGLVRSNLGYAQDRELGVAEIEAKMTWLDDPTRERPTFSETTYFKLECQRALDACDPERVDFAPLFAELVRMRSLAAPARLAVLLIPDDFQVDDELWRRVRTSQASLALERDLAQREIGAWLERERIPYVDLLPALRALPPLADGRVHAYHLRDTHFNARGNEVASRGLAELVTRCLGLEHTQPSPAPAPQAR